MKITPLVTEQEVRWYNRCLRYENGQRKSQPGIPIAKNMGMSEARAEYIRKMAKWTAR